VIIGYRKHAGEHLPYMKSTEGKIYFDLRDDQDQSIDPTRDPWLDDPIRAEKSRWTGQNIYAYSVTPPTGLGDGTVPDSSGRALPAKPQSYTKAPDGTVEINDGDEKAAGRSHDKTRKRKVAGLKGEEVVYRGTEAEGEKTLYFMWDFPGEKNSAHATYTIVSMMGRDDHLEEKLAIWDALLDSMRPAGR
jgi:hypothetical protein